MKWTLGVGAALLLFSATANAAGGNTLASTDMFAGPGDQFPQVMHLAPDLKVQIHGCLRNGLWCDVTWRGNRGWVAAQSLAYRAGTDRVALEQPAAEVPPVTFDLRAYWEQNYRDRLWYADVNKWEANVARPETAAAQATLHATPRQ